jgi:hypothetical protein
MPRGNLGLIKQFQHSVSMLIRAKANLCECPSFFSVLGKKCGGDAGGVEEGVYKDRSEE